MKRRAAIAALLSLGAGAAVYGARAQSPPRPARIGIVEFGPPPGSGFTRAYLAALQQLGYTEPATLQVERRFANGDAARFPELIQELAASKVDMVFTVGNDIAQAAKRVAPELPVVTAGSEDPVRSGLIADYRHPGGSVTGVTYLSPQLAAKRLELLREVVPALARVGVVRDPAHFDTYYEDMEPAARALGVRLHLRDARSVDEIDRALADLQKEGVQALFIVPSRLINVQASRVSRLALDARLPAIAAYASFTDAGTLMSYGAVGKDMLARAAAQSDKIIRGARAGDLPFEQAATFELVINLRTARTLGLTFPQSVLIRADRVID